MILKQSTARIVRIGPFVDATDAVSPETGVTLGAADQAEILKAGGGASVDISSNTWAAVTGCDGWYDLTLSASNTDTIGDLTVVVQDSSLCRPVSVSFTVVEETIYSELYDTAASVASAVVTGLGDSTGQENIRDGLGMEAANMADLINAIIGKNVVTNNGDGTYDIAVRNLADDADLIVIQYNPTTGTKTIVSGGGAS